MIKATIRSSFLHTSERDGEFLETLHKLDTLCQQPFVPVVHKLLFHCLCIGRQTLVVRGSLSIRDLKEAVHHLRK